MVCRIAEALCQLQNVGHTKYITWSLTFTCSKVTVEKLTGQAANMENELKDLLNSIKEQRLKFHALNYFTTQQLLQIRRQLGNLKQNSTAQVTSQLYSLLSTFSLHITSEDIKDIVERVCKQPESVNEPFEAQLPLIAGVSVATELEEKETVTSRNAGNSQNLSKEEEELFEQLLDLDYSDVVCYNAVKHVFSSNSDDKLTDAMTWCFKNASQYEYDDITSTDGVSTDQGVNESVTVVSEGSSHKDTQLEMNKTSSNKDNDIHHVVVQKLIQSNFTPELAIEGARMFNGDFEQAFEWCSKSKEKSTESQQKTLIVGVSSIKPMAVDSVR